MDHHQSLAIRLVEMIMVIEMEVLAKEMSTFCASDQ